MEFSFLNAEREVGNTLKKIVGPASFQALSLKTLERRKIQMAKISLKEACSHITKDAISYFNIRIKALGLAEEMGQ